MDFPIGKEGIEAVLPHRDPFLWVTRVLACDPGQSVVAELDVSPDLPLFQGHFPDYPVLPGVILMEALAQAASFSVLVDRGAPGGGTWRRRCRSGSRWRPRRPRRPAR